MGAGYLLGRFRLVPENAYKGINAWIIYLALPAFSLKYLSHIEWKTSLIFPALSPVIVLLAGWLLMHLYAQHKKIPPLTGGVLKISAGLCNTSFVGFPLILAYYNEQALGTAIICDQVTFLLLSTAGIVIAVRSSGTNKASFTLVLSRLLKFPPFWGCLLALTVARWFDLSALDGLFDKLAATVGPLALFSIGLQLQFSGWRTEIPVLSAVLFYKLLLAPALVLGIALLAGLQGEVVRISVFEAAMPTLLTAVIVAAEYRLDGRMAGFIVGLGILLSFVTTAGWYWLMEYIL